MTTRRAIGPMISVYHDLPSDAFRTAFFDLAFVTQIGFVSHPLKTTVITTVISATSIIIILSLSLSLLLLSLLSLSFYSRVSTATREGTQESDLAGTPR